MPALYSQNMGMNFCGLGHVQTCVARLHDAALKGRQRERSERWQASWGDVARERSERPLPVLFMPSSTQSTLEL